MQHYKSDCAGILPRVELNDLLALYFAAAPDHFRFATVLALTQRLYQVIEQLKKELLKKN